MGKWTISIFFNLSIYLFICIFIHSFVKCKQNFDTLFSLSTCLGNGLVYKHSFIKGLKIRDRDSNFLLSAMEHLSKIPFAAWHYSDVTCASWRPKAPVTRLFVLLFGPCIWSMYLVHAQTHLGQVGKWPWRCTTTGLDNSMESQTKIIRPVILEICVPQCLDPTDCSSIRVDKPI